MSYYVGKDADKITLRHFGIVGMKWGVRRYQNKDGTLTESGKLRYYDRADKKQAKQFQKRLNSLDQVYSEASHKVSSLTRKQEEKNPNGKKFLRLEKQINDERALASLAKTKMDSILGEASSKGYTISSKKVTRMSENGKAIALGLLQGAAGLAIANLPVATINYAYWAWGGR